MQRRTFFLSIVSPCVAAAARVVPQPPIVRAWLGTAERRHGHDALGTGIYPGTLHALVRHRGKTIPLRLDLPADSAFEDGLLRRVDLGGPGSDDLVLVTASRRSGAAIAVYGVELHRDTPVLRERAKSPVTGPGRWMNPVGFGDFDGDGKLEVVSVSTPHVGGVLSLYRYEPPHLVRVAVTGNVSNHAYGQTEQRLAAVLQREGRTIVVVPDQSRLRLRSLFPAGDGQWQPAAADLVFDRPIDLITRSDTGALQVQAGAETRFYP